MQQLVLVVFWASIATLAAGQSLEIFPAGDTQTRAVNDSIVFKCQATGLDNEESDPNLKWFDPQGKEITETSGRKYVEYIDKQEMRLYVRNIYNVDAGTYECRGNVEGNYMVQSIRLSIYKDITFDHAPSPQNPTLHTDALIECEVSGQPAPEVSWRYKGEKITTGGRYTLTTKGLEIKNITEEDNGNYDCRAEVAVDGRFDERRIFVEVYILPEVTRPPGNEEGIEGHETSLTCYATGKPQPQYEFYKDDNNFPVSPNERIHIDKDNGEIAFRPVQKGDEGNYRCEAINYAGTDSAQGSLFVVVPPRVTELFNVSALEESTATLKCITNADPDATMAWRKVGNLDDYEEGENEGGRIVVTQVSGDELQLTVKELTPDDQSNYTCKAVNRGGDTAKNGTITVEFSPRFDPDHIDHFYNWAGKTRNMSCHALGEPEPFIEWVRFDEVLHINETYHIYSMGRTSNLAVTIRNEDQAWIYGDYTCRATNKHGSGEQAIELRRANVPDQPKDVYAKDSTPTTVVLEVVPPDEDGGVEIYAYRVEFESKSQDFDIDQEIKLENLRPETNYIFRVRAKNEVGAGAPKDYAHKTEPIRTPYPIEITSDPTGVYPYKYTVHWAPPRTGGLPIKEYRFRYRRVKVDDDSGAINPIDSWTTRDKDDDPDQPMLSYLLENLQHRQHYQLEVTARNDLGWSEPHPDFVFLTAEAHEPPGGVIGAAGHLSPLRLPLLLLTVALAAFRLGL